jgi:hypothetical protein
MAQLKTWLGVVSTIGVLVACGGNGSSGTPIAAGGAATTAGGGGAPGNAGSTAMGGSTTMAGAAGSSPTAGAGGASGPSCTATAAATTVIAPYAITADATGNVYWSNSSDTEPCSNTIMMQAPGGMPTEIAKVDQSTASAGSPNIAKALALDGLGNIYYGAGYGLYRVKAQPASAPTKIGTFDGKPTSIVPTAMRIFTSLDFDNAVQWRSPDPASSGCTDPITRPKPVDGETDAQKAARINGGGCAFSESIANLAYDSLWLAGKLLVFMDGSNIDAANSTVDATKEAGHTQIAATDSFNQISGMTAFGSTVYFGEATGGIIEKAPVPAEQPAMAVSTPPTILLTDPTLIAPSSFVNDGKSIFFRTGAAAADSCAVMMMTTTGTATQLTKVDGCGKMILAVGDKLLWYTDRAHNLVKSVAIPQ